MSAKHTPGPWRIFQTKGKPRFYVIGIGREDGRGITDGNVGLGVWDADSPEALANGRLIAAAPDLLSALRDLLDAFDICPDDLPGHEYEAIVEDARQRARAAIAKAKGE